MTKHQLIFAQTLRAERQKDGYLKAQKNWGVFGAKNKQSNVRVKELQQRRVNGGFKTLMKDYEYSKMSVYRYLKQA